jgi:ABC-type multidrug transport system ATPase subunit/ABC-type multidrug transport system permease subunit
MATNRPAAPSSTSPLAVRTQGASRSLPPGPAYRLGRDPESDIHVDDARVSWRHAVLKLDQGAWILEDAGSTNGTYLGSRRVDRVEVGTGCTVRLGHPTDGPEVHCALAEPVPPAPGVGQTRQAYPGSAPPQYAAGYAPATDYPVTDGRETAGQPRAGAGLAERGGGNVGAVAPGQLDRHRPASSVRLLPATVLRIGRAPDNDIVVPDLEVSRHHAELRSIGGSYQITDLGSRYGTYVNGQQITVAPLTERDILGIGRSTFRLSGTELQEFVDTGDVSLAASGLTVRLPSGKVLLDGVSFPLGERCLLAVIGPSGAGKSTLLGALTGMRPATEGSVTYDGRDLYANYAELRHRIGLVPQENILHTQLTARRALRYAAQLRFPKDTSRSERNKRVDEVLAELSLTAHAETRTDRLSGGQQKRVNVALELMTKPSVLFLDEPTSGLDPGLDKSVMEMMSGLAHDGRTVIVVTHSVANLYVCDRLLVLVPGGKVAFFGPPEDGLRHFGKPGWAEVFQAFEQEPGRDWAGEFRRSPWHAKYVTEAMAAPRPAAGTRKVPPPPKSKNRLSQFSTLCRRYMAVIASDRVYLALLAGAPIVLGGVILVIPDKAGLTLGHHATGPPGSPPSNPGAESLLLIMIISACFAGAFNSVRELVKERAIYSRERAAGLSPASYLASKLAVLGLISGVQAVVLVLIGLIGRPLPRHGAWLKSLPLVELILAIAVLAIVSMALGLLISASVNTSEKTMPLLMVLVVVEVILTGGVFAIAGKPGLEQVAWLSPSRWGFAATASTSHLNKLVPPAPGAAVDSLWRHNAHTWLMDVGILLGLGLVYSLLTWRRLVRQGPGRKLR